MANQLVESEMRVFEVPLSAILCDNDFNCRGPIAPVDVIDLSRSIEESGLQQPITIQPWNKTPGKEYRIVSGHRRFTAFRVLAKKTIPAILKMGLDELAARQLNLEENLKRKDLNLLQEANALKPFISAGWTQEEMASRFNQSRGWVQARVALLELPEEIQQEAAAGFLTQEHIKQLKSIKSKKDQFEAVLRIKQSKLNNRREKIQVAPKKQKPLAKRKREPGEIFNMIDMMIGVCGAGMHTRCLAWSAGEISDFELLRDFKQYAKEQHGVDWQIPNSIMQAVIS